MEGKKGGKKERWKETRKETRKERRKERWKEGKKERKQRNLDNSPDSNHDIKLTSSLTSSTSSSVCSRSIEDGINATGATFIPGAVPAPGAAPSADGGAEDGTLVGAVFRGAVTGGGSGGSTAPLSDIDPKLIENRRFVRHQPAFVLLLISCFSKDETVCHDIAVALTVGVVKSVVFGRLFGRESSAGFGLLWFGSGERFRHGRHVLKKKKKQ